MKWSWRIGRVAGIDLHLHLTFALFFAGVTLFWLFTNQPTDVFQSVLLLAALFACVLLHELGHALTARSFGIKTLDITLLPIGGVARLERIPKEPAQELLIAVAGPAVNFAIAAILFVVIVALGANWLDLLMEVVRSAFAIFVAVPPGSATSEIRFLPELLQVNLLLGLFNLLPGFPMDGGRVLRAGLAAIFPHVRATRIAARIGALVAMALVAAGLFSNNPILALVGLFVFLSGRQELAMTNVREMVRGLQVGAAMMTRFLTLPTYETLEHAVAAMLATNQTDFPVVGDDGRYLGMLTRGDLLRELSRRGGGARTIDAARRGLRALSPQQPLEELLDDATGLPPHALPVLEDGKLVGILSSEGIRNMLLVREAMAGSKR